jgi:hypothetical protein
MKSAAAKTIASVILLSFVAMAPPSLLHYIRDFSQRQNHCNQLNEIIANGSINKILDMGIIDRCRWTIFISCAFLSTVLILKGKFHTINACRRAGHP